MILKKLSQKGLMLKLLVIILAIITLKTNQQAVPTPVIGVFTNPTMKSWSQYNCKLNQFIEGSLVKWLQQYGARILPIPYDADRETLRYLFDNINGLYFPDGDINLKLDMPIYSQKIQGDNIYVTNAKYLIDLAKNSNINNNKTYYFPVFGEGLGLQLMTVIEADNYIISDVNQFKKTDNIIVTGDQQSQTMFKNLPPYIFPSLKSENWLFFNHKRAITEEDFRRNAKLTSFYDLKGVFSENTTSTPYVAQIQSKVYPFYAFQYHPHAQQFGIDDKVSKKFEAYKVSQNIALFVYNECRKNQKLFPSDSYQYENSLTYKTDPVKFKRFQTLQSFFIYPVDKLPKKPYRKSQNDALIPMNLVTIIIFVGVLVFLGCFSQQQKKKEKDSRNSHHRNQDGDQQV